MTPANKIKIIATLGPATRTEADLRMIKDKGVDFVRINMSHSTIEDLAYFIALAHKIDIPFIIDTEGSQIRTGDIAENSFFIKENQELKLSTKLMLGQNGLISLKPAGIAEQLQAGDLLHIDIHGLILRVADTKTLAEGYLTLKAVTSGQLTQNKAVVVDTAMPRYFNLPPLSPKDYESIALGLKAGIKHIAASFMRSAAFVNDVRAATKNSMNIIAKIECLDGLNNLDRIIEKSDYLLIDRGDLSKEIPLEKIPFTQKLIISRAADYGKDVFVATNLLESMIKNQSPTRAEVHDVIATILDGAGGLCLSSETAIGQYPMAAINMMNKLIREAVLLKNFDKYREAGRHLAGELEKTNYIFDIAKTSTLIPPHGGKLVNRVLKQIPDESYLNSLRKIKLSENLQMDVEQLAMGAFSPLEGFMNREDFENVLDHLRLANGLVWPLPIILDINKDEAAAINLGDHLALTDETGDLLALMRAEDKYSFDKISSAEKLYGTTNKNHPGVRWLMSLNPVLLGGKIDLIRRRLSPHKEYELTPAQVRRLFTERGWSKVVGFHTRNVVHKSHEYIQLEAMKRSFADGLFIHPIIGKKKPGDYEASYIINTYESMVKDFYPKDKVVLATFATFSRYAGPREAIFTALCRQNYGCSHFVVGRDHTGVGNYYHPNAAHEIFDRFPDLIIQPIKFDKVFYSKKLNEHLHEPEHPDHPEDDKLHISGTEARAIFEKGMAPPAWFMRPEISQIIIDALKAGEQVFVPEAKLAEPTDDSKVNSLARVYWFTGLSGSGKTTLAEALSKHLQKNSKKILILDGDAVRNNLHKHLGFSREDIRENNRLIAELAKEKQKDYDFILIPIISPYLEDRLLAKEIIGENFKELYIKCSLKTCEDRDTKGLYTKAKLGEITNLIGYSESNPYEAPLKADIIIDTENQSFDQSLAELLTYFV